MMFDLFFQILNPILHPSSLAFFVIFSLIIAVIDLVWLHYIDDSNNYPLPDPNRLTPLEIAALRGNTERVIQTALFALWHRQLLTIEGKGTEARFKTARLKKNTILAEEQPLKKGQLLQKSITPTEEQLQNEVEKAIYQFCTQSKKLEEFFNFFRNTSKSLGPSLDPHLQSINQTIVHLHLKFNEAQERKIRYIRSVSLSLILGIGVIKLILKMLYGYPVWWFILLLIVIFLTVLSMLEPEWKTALGRRFQRKLVQEFKWMGRRKEWLSFDRVYHKGDPMFYIAIFGPNLPDTEAFKPFNDVFAKEKDSGTKGGSSGNSGSSGFTYGGSPF